MNSNEARLWKDYQNGSHNALFTIYEIMFPLLLRNGMSIIRDKNFVHGVIDQFFLYLWDKRMNLSTPANLASYLIVSFKRFLLQDVKKEKRSYCMANPDVAEPSQEDQLISNQLLIELQQKIGKAMQKLSPRQNQLIVLRYYEGLTCDQIAKRTALTHRTVYNKLYEALKLLRREMSAVDFHFISLIFFHTKG